MTFNAFCLTQEEKDKIYEAIMAEAKYPIISQSSDLFLGENIYSITNSQLREAILKDKEEASRAAEHLRSFPPSILIPTFYELKLEGKLRTPVDFYANMYKSETNEYEESSYLYILNNKPIVRKKRGLDEVVIKHSRCEGSIRNAFMWMINPKASYESNFRAYWWLEGRRFMPDIWNDWYPCWQNEMSRKEPRASVIEQLTKDIGGFGTFLFPHLNEAIKEGDDTLDPVLKEVSYSTEVALPSAKDFCEWYSTNHFKYDYPPCEGIRKTIEKVKDPYILSELKGEDTYDDKEKYGDKWAFHAFKRNVFKQVLWQAEDYYKNREYPPDYWYYKLPDEAVYEYSGEIPSFSGSTNFNKGFLKKIEEKRK